MSYDAALTTTLDRARFLVHDTGATELYPDSTYTALLSQFSDNEFLTAAAIADSEAARWAALPSTTNVDLSVGAERFKQYTDLAKSLRDRPAAIAKSNKMASMDVGGRKISEKVALTGDAALVQPTFKKGQDDNLYIPGRDPTIAGGG